jgi:ribose 5-phosphate isomerase B
MKVYLGTDHGGFEMKEAIKKWLLENSYEVEDCGAFKLNPEDDYPDFVFLAAQKVAADPTDQSLGVIFCRSSAGAVIAANKVKGIRAVSVADEKSAQHAREHNDANVIGISGDWSTIEQAEKIVAAFLTTPFTNEPRHQRRIDKITQYEQGK